MSLGIKSISQKNGLILLYHSIANDIQGSLKDSLHNVTPQTFEKHLSQLSDYFQFVSLEEYANANSKKGLAAITFDDGYTNVINHALPIIEAFNYPATLFLNPVTFENCFNWRDKVRYLMQHELVDDFLLRFQPGYIEGHFYRYSKHPENNSAQFDAALDEYLKNCQIDIYNGFPYLTKETLLTNHPLINYGNHTHNHYVLASLEPEQQTHEINNAHQLLADKHKLTLSGCFSAPFGGSNDINKFTIQVIEQLAYKSLLMSRQRLQSKNHWRGNIQVLERFMPRSEEICSELTSK